MPWSGTSIMDQKRFLIEDFLTGHFTITELAEQYLVSRPTVYKILKRFKRDGYPGLEEHSRAPHHIPHKTPAEVEQLILAERMERGFCGRKILRRLSLRHPDLKLPAISTADEIIKRNGLLHYTKKRRRPKPRRPIVRPQEPNDVWATDFKGEFLLGCRRKCYPLTISDLYSRYIIGIKALPSPCYEDTRAFFEYVFREYGLPKQILSDNGNPFAAAQALHRLSRLAIWWIKLGILPVLIQPGNPQQNGKHERMHKELKRKTTKPPAHSFGRQQKKIDAFIAEHNYEKPHDSLNDRFPDELYGPSSRKYPDKLLPPEYPVHFQVRKVSKNAGFKWKDQRVPIGTIFAGEAVGFDPVDDGLWHVYFYNQKIGYFDERKLRIMDSRGRYKRNLV